MTPVFIHISEEPLRSTLHVTLRSLGYQSRDLSAGPSQPVSDDRVVVLTGVEQDCSFLRAFPAHVDIDILHLTEGVQILEPAYPRAVRRAETHLLPFDVRELEGFLEAASAERDLSAR